MIKARQPAIPGWTRLSIPVASAQVLLQSRRQTKMIAINGGSHDFFIRRSQVTGFLEMDRGFPVIAQLVKRQGQVEMGFRQIGVCLNRRFKPAFRRLPLPGIILLNPFKIVMSRSRTRHRQNGERS